MRARVRSEASSLKIPQDQCDKKTLRVTGTTQANTKFMIHDCERTVAVQ